MKGLEMIALKRSLLLAAFLLAVWAGTQSIESSFAQEKNPDLKLQQISMLTPDLWSLSCFPDGSGNVCGPSSSGNHSAYFKPGTLEFQAMATRIRELSRKEAKKFDPVGTGTTLSLSYEDK